jgi:hypothetical protein
MPIERTAEIIGPIENEVVRPEKSGGGVGI